MHARGGEQHTRVVLGDERRAADHDVPMLAEKVEVHIPECCCIHSLPLVAGRLSHTVTGNLRRVADDRKKGCGGKSWAAPACRELSRGLPLKRLNHHAAPTAPLLAESSAVVPMSR